MSTEDTVMTDIVKEDVSLFYAYRRCGFTAHLTDWLLYDTKRYFSDQAIRFG